MYLLDTNHVSKILELWPRAVQRLGRAGSENVAVPFVVCGELLYMVHKSQHMEANLRVIRRFLQRTRIIHSDDEVCGTYADLKNALVSRFGPREPRKRESVRLHQLGIDDNDLWIAATAIRHGLTLVSADSDFARIRTVRDFRLESWL